MFSCPMVSGSERDNWVKCIEENCMWWNEIHSCCAIPHNAAAQNYHLEKLTEKLETIIMILAKES